MDIRKKRIKVVCCYAREDQQFLHELNKHLASLQRVGDITLWADIHIFPGTEWDTRLDQAQIILLLVSATFIRSNYCYHQEMQRALHRHQRREASVIPVILTPVMWEITPLGELQALPKDAKPITTWPNRDEAYKNVADYSSKAFFSYPVTIQKIHKTEQIPRLTDAFQNASSTANRYKGKPSA